MNQDIDLDRWQLLWRARADGPTADDLRDRVERETRRQVVALILPALVTVVIGGGMAARAFSTGTVADIAYAVETWLFIAATWAGALWIARGDWRPLGQSTVAFVEISIRRCRAVVNSLRLAVGLYVVQLAVTLALHGYFSSAGWTVLLTSAPMIAIGWVGLPLAIVAAGYVIRRKTRELAGLLELRRQLTGN